jgi:hypothetical protein
MAGKKFHNGQAVLLQMLFQGEEGADQTQGQPAFGPRDGGRAGKLGGFGKSLQTLVGRLRPVESVAMEKVLPATLSGFG